MQELLDKAALFTAKKDAGEEGGLMSPTKTAEASSAEWVFSFTLFMQLVIVIGEQKKKRMKCLWARLRDMAPVQL